MGQTFKRIGIIHNEQLNNKPKSAFEVLRVVTCISLHILIFWLTHPSRGDSLAFLFKGNLQGNKTFKNQESLLSLQVIFHGGKIHL